MSGFVKAKTTQCEVFRTGKHEAALFACGVVAYLKYTARFARSERPFLKNFLIAEFLT